MTLAVNIAQGGSNNVTFRNKLINGAMNVWQRATSYSVSGAYSYGAADRWASTVSSGSAVSLTSGTYANITSISLTAGDWDITGVVAITTPGTTTITYINYGVSTSSATAGSLGQMGSLTSNTNIAATVDFTAAVPVTRLSLASTTTVYLVSRASFAVSTASAYGVIRARRVR